MLPRRTRSALAALLSLVALAVALGAAGCGGDDSSSGSTGAGPDPATLVPAAAPVYVEATIKPDGAARDGALAAARRITRVDDPLGRLRELLDRSLDRAAGKPSFSEDVEPWLGKRVGLFVSDLQTGDDPSVAVIAALSDRDEATDAIKRLIKAQSAPVRAGSQNGVRYGIIDDTAYVVLGDFLVLGQEGAVRQVISARSGQALAKSDRYRQATGDLPADRLASFYMDVRTIVGMAAKQDPRGAEALQMFGSLVDLSKAPPIVASLRADGDRVAIDATSSTSAYGPLGNLPTNGAQGPGSLFEQVPDDSWLVYGVPKLGESAKALFTSLTGVAGGAITRRLRRQSGLDLERDVFSWIGDAALFVRGDSMANLNGAIVIQTTDEGAADRAVRKLLAAASAQADPSEFAPRPTSVPGASRAVQLASQELPAPMIIAVGNGRLVLAIGRQAAAEGIRPSRPLGRSGLVSRAGKALGDDLQPSLLLSIPEVLRLAEAAGANSEAVYQQAKPYLAAFDVLALGARTDGDRLVQRVGVSLK